MKDTDQQEPDQIGQCRPMPLQQPAQEANFCSNWCRTARTWSMTANFSVFFFFPHIQLVTNRKSQICSQTNQIRCSCSSQPPSSFCRPTDPIGAHLKPPPFNSTALGSSDFKLLPESTDGDWPSCYGKLWGNSRFVPNCVICLSP